MEQGTVLRGIGGFYRVLLDNGRVVDCRPRGRLRLQPAGLLAGDRVDVSVLPDGTGAVEAVHPRRSRLRRPPVANVDRVVAVMALADPEPNLLLLDRLLTMAEASELDVLVCWTKADLAGREQAERLAGLYRRAGYPAVVTSSRTGEGIEQLQQALAGRLSTLAGPSGVGKSALLNALVPGLSRATGEVSRKLRRGRHTTREVELLRLPRGGLVADTPGFSQLELTEIGKNRLGLLMRDIARFAAECRFPGCLHRREPACSVRAAVDRGDIDRGRYRHYLIFLDEIEAWEARRYS
ncbi:MAG: ribosome small subunit-dependent GTPase A [Firmicutes bacterium]|nr:ribosome small subunit-dependent GTPase A [Bacillota bacterium]